MNDLAEFLLARIGEDEAAASAAIASAERFAKLGISTRWEWAALRSDTGHSFVPGVPGPARVLAECEAKRYLVDLYRAMTTENRSRALVIELMIQFAAVYADHPDYREVWRS